jgi:tripartite-type tricarboxylate transporter receptor subunit TctC
MKSMKSRFALILTSTAALLVAGSALAADAWPSKPVNIVVSFVPGGATDMVGRIIATELSTTFKQPFIVSNRPGAAGQVGTEYVAAQAHDGYTLLISATGHVMAPSMQSKVNYDPVKSFEPVSLLITMPNLLVVNPNIPAKTLPEFITWARTQKTVPFGTAGAGGSTHLSGELFRHLSGLPLSHIPYKGNGPSMTDVMGGQIPAAFVDTVSVGSLVSTGKVRAIAVTSGQRSTLYPDAPTIAEAGYKDYDLVNWVGLYAPAGTPAETVSRLNKEVVRIMNSPDVLARMQKLGADSSNKFDPQQFKKYVEDETRKWRKTIQLTGVSVEN